MAGGNTTTSDTTSNQINQIPQWMSDAGQQNYAYAQNVAQQPLQQYQGQMVADVAPQTQQAWNVAANSGNVGSDQYNAATAGYLGALGQSAPQAALAPWVAPAYGTLAAPVTAAQAKTAQAAAAQQAALAAPTVASTADLSQLSKTNLGAYMNPYTQDVINKTLPIMNQSLQNQQNALANQANQSNAFGGSRQAITQGVMGAQGAQSEAQMAAQLNQANYAQAQAAGEFDVGQGNQMSEFNAGQRNQVGMYNQGQANQVGMFNAGQGNQVNVANAQMANAANQFNAGQSNQVNLADMSAANAMSQFNAGAANNMRQFDTSQINSMNQFNATAQQNKINSNLAASQGLTNTGTAMNAANAANYNMLTSAGASQSMQAQNQINAQMAKFNQAYNYPQQQLGVLEGSLGMTPHDTSSSGQSSTQTTTPTDWASLIKGGGDAASSVLGMMGVGSDKSMKTDVTKLGKDPKTGLQMHAYRYKGDPKTYPKVVGPMAQEVQEKYPDKAKRLGGKLTVDPSIMAASGVQGFAAGTPFVGPSLAAFTPPSSPGVAKGIGALSAFRPPTRMPRGLGVPKMQKFADGTADVQAPDMSNIDDNAFDTGGDSGFLGKLAQGASKVGGDLSKGGGKGSAAPGLQPGQPSMGYLVSGYAAGVPRVPGYGTGDTVPAMLTPGEAVLNRHAAQQLGRGNIAALNATAPMGIAGALANLKRRPKIAGGLSG